MHFLGFNVMARRIPDFPDSFHSWNFLSSIGSGITFLSFAMLTNVEPLLMKRKKKKKINARRPLCPWLCGAALTLGILAVPWSLVSSYVKMNSNLKSGFLLPPLRHPLPPSVFSGSKLRQTLLESQFLEPRERRERSLRVFGVFY